MKTERKDPDSWTETKHSHFEQIGGEEGLRKIITAFIERVYADPIIGFFFNGVDMQALIEREIEFATLHLGGKTRYTGRPLSVAHRPHRINKGQFYRRLWLLEKVLQDFQVPEEVRIAWIDYNKRLEPMITDGTDCSPTDASR